MTGRAIAFPSSSQRQAHDPGTPAVHKAGAQASVDAVETPIIVSLWDMRFSHNDISECFRPEEGVAWRRSVLQTAIELLAGVLSPIALPIFDVCAHEGRWYCRSGNRRLAAYQLAALID